LILSHKIYGQKNLQTLSQVIFILFKQLKI
jgi:hypothetical protein